MTRARRLLTAPLALTLFGIALSGCVTTIADPVTGRYTRPIGDAPVIANETPYSKSLECLAAYNAGRPAPRIAVGQIADYTFKEEADGSGRKITQGAALMAISALSKAGVRLVERFDTSVAELELKYANNKLIGDEENHDPYRKILAGSIPGSDYYLVGGITELNFNIRSECGEADYSGTSTKSVKANVSANTYVMNVGLDLRLVDTRTLEVVDVISYQKQIIGRQISAGVFDFFGTNIINVGGGDSALEPLQLAVRSVIERAVLEMVSRLYDVDPLTCGGGPLYDPLADSSEEPAGAATLKTAPRAAAASRSDTSTSAPVSPQAAAKAQKAALAASPATSTPEAMAAKPENSAAPPPIRAVLSSQDPVRRPATPKTSKDTKETVHVKTEDSSYRWYRASDGRQPSGLRGRIE